MAHLRTEPNASLYGPPARVPPASMMPAPCFSATVGKELVRAYSASRDGKRIDRRRDAAYHNRMLFAASELAAAFPKP